MELFIFARFHAREGAEDEVAAAIHETTAVTSEQPGCLATTAHRSIRDPGLFHVHTHWADEAAFDTHAGLPHIVRFLELVLPLIDHPLDVTRTRKLER
jgi:quinol monooxygenase YgiN